MLYINVYNVIAHVIVWLLSLKLSTEDVVDSRPYPPSLGMRGEGEVVWLHKAEAYKCGESNKITSSLVTDKLFDSIQAGRFSSVE